MTARWIRYTTERQLVKELNDAKCILVPLKAKYRQGGKTYKN